MYGTPDKPTPNGCLVGFFIILSTCSSILAFWGAFKAYTNDPPLTQTANNLAIWGAISLFPAILWFIIYLVKVFRHEN